MDMISSDLFRKLVHQRINMAYTHQLITNRINGQTVRFLQTAKDTRGARLEMESIYAVHSAPPPPHYHPNQDEYFIVMDGKLTVSMNHTIRIFEKGEKFIVPRNTVHAMWNEGTEPVVVNWQVCPAMNTEDLMVAGMMLANEGMLNEKGRPPLVISAQLFRQFRQEYRLASPPYWLQCLLLIPIAFIVRLFQSKGKTTGATAFPLTR
jgi:quercetin dioxygenase-like cupin family protein